MCEGTQRDRGETYGDIFTFKGGRFRSAACDAWDFGSGPYTTSAVDGVTRFEAETASPTDGRMAWKGVVTGDKLQGTMRWYPQPDAAPVGYWFSGIEN